MVVLLPVLGMSRRRSEGVGAPIAPAGGIPARYSWVTSDVWGVPSRMTDADLQRLRDQGAVCGGGGVSLSASMSSSSPLLMRVFAI
ncbi:hypothetical protein AHAS_Ahas18G0228600 [Arachis hypogaea]